VDTNKAVAVIEHWRRYMANDAPPNTPHQTAYAMGCIDGLRLAIVLQDNPDFDVAKFRSEFPYDKPEEEGKE
jgi:hypothetical protein